MNTLKTLFANLTTPKRLTPRDGIHFWQEKVLLNLLLVSVVLGFITWVPSMAVSGYFFPILTGVLLGARPASWTLVINGITVAGIGILTQLNLTELLSQFNFKVWFLATHNSLEKWVVICCNFMLLNILATLSVTTILKGLHNSLQKLAVSDQKHRRIFENILDVYFETSLDGIILEVSPSVTQIFGYSPKELKGQPIYTVFTPDNKNSHLLDRLISTGHIQDHEISIAHNIRTAANLFCQCQDHSG